MSRYIDADELTEFVERRFDITWEHDYEGGIKDACVDILDFIDSAPSIDIVRCRECKYWKSTVQMPNGTEVKCLYGRKADDFCSYGEREGE